VGRERGRGYGGKRERGGKIVRTVIVVIIFLKLTSRSIFDNRENGLPYFTYVVAVISVRLSECFCISIAFLYFFGKYDVVVVIVIVLSNGI